MERQPPSGPGPSHCQGFTITHDDVPQSVGLLWTSDEPRRRDFYMTTLTRDMHLCFRRDSNPQFSSEWPKTHALRCPYTYESGWRVRLGSGSNESNSSVCGVSRAGLGADPGLACQGLRWGSARRRLAVGSYVCGRFQARLTYPHGHKHRQCEFCH
jgi:hypothetical protein